MAFYAGKPQGVFTALRRGEAVMVCFGPSGEELEEWIKREFSDEQLDWDRIDDIGCLVRLVGERRWPVASEPRGSSFSAASTT